MAYDEDLANRMRELLAEEDAVTERKMFGGLAFVLHGNMSVSASGRGGLLARIDPAETDAALARPHASLMHMRGRTMEGWIRVAPEGIATKRQLAPWVKRSLAYDAQGGGCLSASHSLPRASWKLHRAGLPCVGGADW